MTDWDADRNEARSADRDGEDLQRDYDRWLDWHRGDWTSAEDEIAWYERTRGPVRRVSDEARDDRDFAEDLERNHTYDDVRPTPRDAA